MDYKDAGVNVELGDDASKILYNASRLTWENRKDKLGEIEEMFDDFSGLRCWEAGGLPKGTKTNVGFDGVGTKIELAERLHKHDTVAYDLFAMVCDDAVLRGGEPVAVGSILDVNSLGNEDESYIEFVKQLAIGYINAAREAGVAVVNGEIAELGARVKGYGSFNYNWGAGVVWYGHQSRLLSGKEIQVGDKLVGLYEEGFRSNGNSLVRKIMEKVHGPLWHDLPSKEGNQILGDLVLTPSRIYTKAIVDMNGGYDLDRKPKAIIHGLSHITGGGIPGKLGRVLKPSGYGAEIDNPLEPSEFVRYVQALGYVSDYEAYKTWGMGPGMIVITPTPDQVMEVAHSHNIESKVIGHIRKEPGIKIFNVGAFSPFYNKREIRNKGEDWLNYD